MIKLLFLLRLGRLNRNGQVIEVVGSTVDITERKKVESELSATKRIIGIIYKAQSRCYYHF